MRDALSNSTSARELQFRKIPGPHSPFGKLYTSGQGALDRIGDYSVPIPDIRVNVIQFYALPANYLLHGMFPKC